MSKEKYSVYNKHSFMIIKTNLTRNAAIKFASTNENYDYGSGAWVEDLYRIKCHPKQQLNQKKLDLVNKIIELDSKFKKGEAVKWYSFWRHGSVKGTVLNKIKNRKIYKVDSVWGVYEVPESFLERVK